CSFLFTHTSTTEIYTLSLHDALPILQCGEGSPVNGYCPRREPPTPTGAAAFPASVGLTVPRRSRCNVVSSSSVPGSSSSPSSERSEEHTSELQSRENLVCRLLLEKKK